MYSPPPPLELGAFKFQPDEIEPREGGLFFNRHPQVPVHRDDCRCSSESTPAITGGRIQDDAPIPLPMRWNGSIPMFNLVIAICNSK